MMKSRRTPWLAVVVALLLLVCASARYTLPRPLPHLVIEDLDFTGDKEVPLTAVDVQVEMIFSLAKVSITQTYKNPLDRPIRTSYVFPLDDRATITSFLAEFSNGKKLVGISKEKQEARQEFEDAVQAGHTAVIMDQEASDVFKTEIGNLEAHQEVSITITYLTQVQMENARSYRFFLPTIVASRYQSSLAHARGAASTTASTTTTGPDKIQTTVPYSLNLDMSISVDGIKAISSPTHEISTIVRGDSRTATVSLVSGELDGDFVVVVETKDSQTTEFVPESVPGTKEDIALYIKLDPSDFVLPPSSLDDGQIELIFVVDVSGSMMGEKMEDTIKAMKTAMAELKSSKRSRILFNVVPFSSHYTSLFPESRPLNEQTYEQAIEFISRMQAGGGTEIFKPLKFIYDSSLLAERRRVIVLTDGLVADTEAVLKLTKDNSKHTQVFSVGIGNGVSHALVNGLARAGSGVAEYVTLGEQVSEKMTRQLGRALSSTSVNVKVLFYADDYQQTAPLSVTQSPSVLPEVFSDSTWDAFFLAPSSTRAIVIEADNGKRRVAFLAETSTRRSDIIHKMAARSRVRDLELELESDEYTSLGLTEKSDAQKALRAEIIELAVRYNLMSSLTSFVAVDPDAPAKDRNEPPTPISVPVHSERGTGRSGIMHMKVARHHMAYNAMPTMQHTFGQGVAESINTISQISPDALVHSFEDDISPEAEERRLEQERLNERSTDDSNDSTDMNRADDSQDTSTESKNSSHWWSHFGDIWEFLGSITWFLFELLAEIF